MPKLKVGDRVALTDDGLAVATQESLKRFYTTRPANRLVKGTIVEINESYGAVVKMDAEDCKFNSAAGVELNCFHAPDRMLRKLRKGR